MGNWGYNLLIGVISPHVYTVVIDGDRHSLSKVANRYMGAGPPCTSHKDFISSSKRFSTNSSSNLTPSGIFKKLRPLFPRPPRQRLRGHWPDSRCRWSGSQLRILDKIEARFESLACWYPKGTNILLMVRNPTWKSVELVVEIPLFTGF